MILFRKKFNLRYFKFFLENSEQIFLQRRGKKRLTEMAIEATIFVALMPRHLAE